MYFHLRTFTMFCRHTIMGLVSLFNLHLSVFLNISIGEGNGNPLQCSCLGNPRDGGAWWAAVYGVAQSRTRLRRLSSSSSSIDNFVVYNYWCCWSPPCCWLFCVTFIFWIFFSLCWFQISCMFLFQLTSRIGYYHYFYLLRKLILELYGL